MANSAWNPADRSNVTLSGSNLIAASTAASSWVRAIDRKTSGKFYWEITATAWTGGSTGIGVTDATTVPTGWANIGVIALFNDGRVYLSGSVVASGITGAGTGAVVGIALDAGGSLAWWRTAPSGNWNGSGTANPATGVGGVSLSILSGGVYPLSLFSNTSDVHTANFGDTAFSGAVPAGFTAGFGTAAAGGIAQARAMVLA